MACQRPSRRSPLAAALAIVTLALALPGATACKRAPSASSSPDAASTAAPLAANTAPARPKDAGDEDAKDDAASAGDAGTGAGERRCRPLQLAPSICRAIPERPPFDETDWFRDRQAKAPPARDMPAQCHEVRVGPKHEVALECVAATQRTTGTGLVAMTSVTLVMSREIWVVRDRVPVRIFDAIEAIDSLHDFDFDAKEGVIFAIDIALDSDGLGVTVREEKAECAEAGATLSRDRERAATEDPSTRELTLPSIALLGSLVRTTCAAKGHYAWASGRFVRQGHAPAPPAPAPRK